MDGIYLINLVTTFTKVSKLTYKNYVINKKNKI